MVFITLVHAKRHWCMARPWPLPARAWAGALNPAAGRATQRRRAAGPDLVLQGEIMRLEMDGPLAAHADADADAENGLRGDI